MPVCAFVSFRLGLPDGVSVAATHWQTAFETLGFETVTVAGEGPVDRTVLGLAIGSAHPPNEDHLVAALRDVDLIVIENLCTIPLNLPAARVVAAVCGGRPTVMHHHDPPWQRERFRHVTELPIDDPAWRHVTINELTRREFSDRGIEATCIYNGFPIDRLGQGIAVRDALDISPDQRLIAHPVRAIERKDVATAVHLATQLGGTYWLWGPAEEGYGPTLETLLAEAKCPVRRGTPDALPRDLYAACDAVVYPSRWEGFGMVPIEAAIYRRPVVVGAYRVADELRAMGFRWFGVNEVSALDAFLTAPNPEHHDHNWAIVGERLSLSAMTEQIRCLLHDAGWLP